jgi:hypothetical protein
VTLGKTREWTEQKSAEIFFPKNKQKAAEKSAAFCVEVLKQLVRRMLGVDAQTFSTINRNAIEVLLLKERTQFIRNVRSLIGNIRYRRQSVYFYGIERNRIAALIIMVLL